MSVEVNVVQMHDTNTGRCLGVDARAYITFSPREGFDAAKLAAFEAELTELCKKRLNDALRKGGEA